MNETHEAEQNKTSSEGKTISRGPFLGFDDAKSTEDETQNVFCLARKAVWGFLICR